MRKITVLIELDVKKLSDIDALQDMIEEALSEALDQDEEVSIKVTAEFSKGRG
jgi:DNA-binding protein YbaB